MDVLSKLKEVKLFVLDVDGVLTDGNIILFDDGQAARRMNIKDGYALQLAVKKGYQILIISGAASGAVRIRLERLGIAHINFAVKNKALLLQKFVAENNLLWPQVLYMGDDMPDLTCMQMAGVACAPADAVPEIKSVAHYISPCTGGAGCVRDVIEKVLKLNEHWHDNEGEITSA